MEANRRNGLISGIISIVLFGIFYLYDMLTAIDSFYARFTGWYYVLFLIKYALPLAFMVITIIYGIKLLMLKDYDFGIPLIIVPGIPFIIIAYIFLFLSKIVGVNV